MKQSIWSLAPLLLSLSGVASAVGLTDSSMTTFVDSLTLTSDFDPVKAAYWTGYIHHRRTPFAISPDGSTAYLAYLDGSETDVHIQKVNPSTFEATGDTITISGGKEAGGLVAHDDGFAVLTNEAMPSGTTNAPADSTPVAVLYRFDASGTQTWKTWLGGPDVDDSYGHMASPDMNGDLVYSNVTGRYAAYFVVTAYDGDASGHYGDSIRYVEDSTGSIVNIEGASSDWGCSHNTGIALEAADAAPYASVCAEDQGALWLNSQGQGMSTVGTKVSNENTTNGAGGESLGGMSGSYSSLARFQNSDGYILAWVSRGAVDLAENTWMGDGYTTCDNRTNGRNVAIATFTDKYTMVQSQASSTVGAADGDSQVNWMTTSTKADQSNAHVATFDDTYALVAWEEIADPFCEYIAFGCRGTFSGAYYQLVSGSGNGSAVGEPLVKDNVYVSGDMVTMGDGRICWPYVSMDWDLSGIVGWGYTSSNVTKMSFACVSLDGSSSSSSSGSSSSAASSSASATTVATSVASASSASVVAAGNNAASTVASSSTVVASPSTVAASPSTLAASSSTVDAVATTPAASTTLATSVKRPCSKTTVYVTAVASDAGSSAPDYTATGSGWAYPTGGSWGGSFFSWSKLGQPESDE